MRFVFDGSDCILLYLLERNHVSFEVVLRRESRLFITFRSNLNRVVYLSQLKIVADSRLCRFFPQWLPKEKHQAITSTLPTRLRPPARGAVFVHTVDCMRDQTTVKEHCVAALHSNRDRGAMPLIRVRPVRPLADGEITRVAQLHAHRVKALWAVGVVQ